MSARGQLTDPAVLERALLGGKAVLTVVSRATGTRFTYRFSRPTDSDDPQRAVWASLLTGADNENDYQFIGTWWPGRREFKMSPKSKLSPTLPSVRGAAWLVSKGAEVLQQAEVWHEGRCLRCGRTLTVPSSIESGFGPECVKHA